MFTGASGSPLTATIMSFLVAIMIPHPVPQKRQTALSHRHSASVSFAAAFKSSGTAMPIAAAALTAAVVFRKSLLDTFTISLLFLKLSNLI